MGNYKTWPYFFKHVTCCALLISQVRLITLLDMQHKKACLHKTVQQKKHDQDFNHPEGSLYSSILFLSIFPALPLFSTHFFAQNLDFLSINLYFSSSVFHNSEGATYLKTKASFKMCPTVKQQTTAHAGRTYVLQPQYPSHRIHSCPN